MHFRGNFKNFSKGCRFTVKNMQIKCICEVTELHKNPRSPLKKRLVFDNSHLKFQKWKRRKLENSIFDGRLIVNQKLSQTDFIIVKSNFSHIKHFQ